jgi:hypothetical protein
MTKHMKKDNRLIGLWTMMAIFFLSLHLAPGAVNAFGHTPFNTTDNRISMYFAQVSENPGNQEKAENTGKNRSAGPSGDKFPSAQTPSGGKLVKEKKSYQKFSPSERIDVDRVVDFPADI